MAVVKPFQAYRPASGREKEIAALPYDVYKYSKSVEYAPIGHFFDENRPNLSLSVVFLAILCQICHGGQYNRHLGRQSHFKNHSVSVSHIKNTSIWLLVFAFKVR